jgi:hypothetical protein
VEIVLELSINIPELITYDYSYPISEWGGDPITQKLYSQSCCDDCTQPCFKGDCNLKNGTCACDSGWSGSTCAISCANCDDIASNNITCSVELTRAVCHCKEGFYGLNCTQGTQLYVIGY